MADVDWQVCKWFDECKNDCQLLDCHVVEYHTICIFNRILPFPISCHESVVGCGDDDLKALPTVVS